MKVTEFPIAGLKLIEPKVFGDERGFFQETYNEKAFIEHGLKMKFVQDNHSKSKNDAKFQHHF